MGTDTPTPPARKTRPSRRFAGNAAEILLLAGFAAGMTAAALPLRPAFFLAEALAALTACSVLARPKWFLWGTLALWPLRELADESILFGIAPYFQLNLKGLLNVMIVFAGLLYLARGRRSVLSHRPVLIFGVFLLAALASLAYSSNAAEGVRFLIRIACPFSFFVIALGEIRNSRDIDALLKTIVLSAVLPVGMGLYQAATGTGFQDVVGLTRLSSVFEHPNAFSFYLVMLYAVLLVFLVRARTVLPRLAALTGCLLASVLLVLTYCRSAWLAAIGVLIWFIFRTRGKRRILAACLVAGAAVAAVLPSAGARMRSTAVLVHAVPDTGAETHVASMQWRFIVWKKLLRKVPEAPFCGHGAGASRGFMKSTFGLDLHPHNNYLLVLYEYGLAGLAVFGAFWGLLAARALRAMKGIRSGPESVFVTLHAAALLSFMTIMAADNIFEQTPSSLYFWTLFAMGEMIVTTSARPKARG